MNIDAGEKLSES